MATAMLMLHFSIYFAATIKKPKQPVCGPSGFVLRPRASPQKHSLNGGKRAENTACFTKHIRFIPAHIFLVTTYPLLHLISARTVKISFQLCSYFELSLEQFIFDRDVI